MTDTQGRGLRSLLELVQLFTQFVGGAVHSFSCWIQHFVNNQNIVWNNNILVIYKMLDLATMLKLCTAPPTKLHSKAELTQKDFVVLHPADAYKRR